MASTVGMNAFLLTAIIVRNARNSGSMFGSDRLPALEKTCSQLPSRQAVCVDVGAT